MSRVRAVSRLCSFLFFVLAPVIFTSAAEATSIAVLTGPGGAGSGLTVNAQNIFSTRFQTGVDFQGDIGGVQDIPAGQAHFVISQIHGSSNPGLGGAINQWTWCGSFALRGTSNELLLSGMVGLGFISSTPGGVRFLSNQILATGGLFGDYFSGHPNGIELDFIGTPTPTYQDQITYESIFTGRYNQQLTGYQTVQTGTTRTLTGYTNGKLRCLDYHGFAGHGCVPVDDSGHILPQYIGKWLFLSSTPTPTPVYDQVPIYTTTPVYAQVPTYQQIPVYEQRQVVHRVFTGWNWATQFAGGEIWGNLCNPAPVPEPMSAALFGLGLIPFVRRRSSVRS